MIVLAALGLLLCACEKHTDATSPCFGDDGKPVVARSASTPLDPVATAVKDCDFEPVGEAP